MGIGQDMSFRAFCRRCRVLRLGKWLHIRLVFNTLNVTSPFLCWVYRSPKSMHHYALASNIDTTNEISQTPGLLQPPQRRHSDAQSRADRLDLSIKPARLSLEEENRERPEILVSLPTHTVKALLKAAGLPKPSLIEGDERKRPSCSQKHTEASSAAAQWVACQAGFVSTHDEPVLSPSLKSHPTRSTQSPANSTASVATTPGSQLPALQSINIADHDGLKPLAAEEIDPASFDLVAPPEAPEPQYSVEVKSELLLSSEHLKVIFDDPKHMQKFTDFLYSLKPESVPLLNYYLSLVKASKAIGYANAIIGELTRVNRAPSSELPLTEAIGKSLMGRANETFGVLAQEELPAYVTHVWNRIVSITIKQRITNTLPPNLRDLSEGLAEVFCLTDPSRDDNPIVFASEEFHRATQYGRRFALGRNCRFLQGPRTNQHSVHRLREMIVVGKEHCEPLLNYRRDGSVFMNLLMVTPLYDNRGNVRYHLGAQVDVSGLLKECAGLASLGELVAQKQNQSASTADDGHADTKESRTSRDVLANLAEMFTLSELKIVQASGGAHADKPNSAGSSSSTNNNNSSKLQSVIKDEAAPTEPEVLMDNSMSSSALTPLSSSSLIGRVRGILDYYLLVRPSPSLRILFASPSLRVPGILQSPFLSRIGGSQSIRDTILQAFKNGEGITTKVRWLARPMMSSGRSASSSASASASPIPERSRWIHTTPLLGVNGAVGVWMVILVDDEEKQRTPSAPPIELFNLERSRPFDVDFSVPNLDTENVDNKSTSDAESVSLEHDEVEVLELP
ncbi:hypothetical protein F4803DRAFT_507639 [Xylaria telfairii]|nr:hypothetical protein F4803DRAFT_507639 [Xylaria telfairii]